MPAHAQVTPAALALTAATPATRLRVALGRRLGQKPLGSGFETGA